MIYGIDLTTLEICRFLEGSKKYGVRKVKYFENNIENVLTRKKGNWVCMLIYFYFRRFKQLLCQINIVYEEYT